MVDSTLGKNAALAGLIAKATYAALYAAAPTGGAAGTELAGVARKSLTWSTPTAGSATASATFTGFADGVATAGTGFHDALTGGGYYGGTSITSRTMQTGDSLTVTYTLSAS